MMNLPDVTDVEFLTFLCLQRLPDERDAWRSLPLPAAKAALRLSYEFYHFNSFNISAIHPSFNFRHDFDEAILARAYQVMLSRLPRLDEINWWRNRGRLDFSRLIWEGFFSAEGFRHDGLSPTGENGSSLRAALAGMQNSVNVMNFDLFIAYRQRATPTPRRTTALPTNRPIAIGMSFFGLSEHDIEVTTAILADVFRFDGALSFKWFTTDQIIDENALSQLDLFISYNNALYHRQAELADKIRTAPCFTCCWLWDNHHQFGLTTLACETFDLCLPAHSNGQTYLHGGRALIGPVVPCCSFQWMSEQVERQQAVVDDGPRSNALFGRFNTYGGRVSARDAFIAAASDSAIETDLMIIPESENKWYLETPEERYDNLARHKVVLCTPVFNDLPARVFDALVAGCIPVVPHGLPDLGQSFTETEIADGVVVTHRPNDVASLERAVARGIAAFDRAGPSGVARRQRIAAERHLLPMRLARIVAESVAAMEV